MVKKMCGLVAFVLVILVILQAAILTVSADKNAIRSDYSDSFELVKNMQVGWNLGNALDSINGSKGNSVKNTETCWGNPVTTKRMIEMVSAAGFKTVRVPVTYFGNSDWDANIDKEWLDRVQEVVDYVLDCNMYCIINVHHDTGKGAWISPDTEKYERSSFRLRRLWQQIAERFKNYDNRLIFEGMNEILNNKEQWTGASNDNYSNVNKLNQIFVDTVRASGGNNSKRFLMVPLYAAIASEQNIGGFKLPKDTISHHLIISYHAYDTNDKRIDYLFNLMKTAFIDKGVPAILGEFGMRNSTKEDNTQRRITYIDKVISGANALGIACIWWDDGGYYSSSGNVTNYSLLDRYNYRWHFPKLVSELVNVAKNSKSVKNTTTVTSGTTQTTKKENTTTKSTTTTSTTKSTTSTTKSTTKSIAKTTASSTTATATTTTRPTVKSASTTKTTTSTTKSVTSAATTKSTTSSKSPSTVQNSLNAGALNFKSMTAGIETDITLGVGCEYDFICSLDNTSGYGDLMISRDSNRIGYRVRQELSQIYTAYGYNNFKALNIVPNQKYTVSQKGNNTYVDGNLIMRNVTQDFNEGKLTIGNCRMMFYGMTIRQNGKVTHQLEPSKDSSNKPCILDKVTGKRYYSAKPDKVVFLAQ